MAVDPASGLRVLTSTDWPQVVVSLSGELDLATADYLRARLLALTSATSGGSGTAGPPPRLVVDLAGVSFVDVAGLAGLLDVADALAAAGGSLCVRHASEIFVRLVRLLGMADRLPAEDGR